jgi:hypothetical protein
LSRPYQTEEMTQLSFASQTARLLFAYSRDKRDNNKSIHNIPIKITAATSITSSGKLWNITTNVNNDTFYLENDNVTGIKSYDHTPLSIEMEFKPIKGLLPGNYTLTIGARYETVSYSKIIDLVVSK